ncbi:hypothetical protein KBZ08_08790 [Cyanobium sp. Candia 9D4]|uniref:hypothetical protein n=1 Tax=Cyanobium sp. Candia 9D4 TaxID=2823707 RepID=UPI0020CDB96E|nr:hypothetical protein [Cyanobium sp. Candia 9D4]MCP9934011.1 hypothetical protein [Cyanobium sp. Candia 9D4]
MAGYQGRETGLVVIPDEVASFKQILDECCFSPSSESILDSSEATYSVNDIDQFFQDGPSVKIVLHSSLLSQLLGQVKSPHLALIAKEQLTRKAVVIYNEELVESDHDDLFLSIPIERHSFRGFSSTGLVHLDIIIYRNDSQYRLVNIALRRISVSFGSGAGYFSIVNQEPEFFIALGGGPQSQWYTEILASEVTDFTSTPASEMIRLNVNSTSSSQLMKMANQNNQTARVLNIMLATNVITTAAMSMLRLCETYPEWDDEESTAAKILPLIGVSEPSQYETIRERCLGNPEYISLRIQSELETSLIVASFQGR